MTSLGRNGIETKAQSPGFAQIIAALSLFVALYLATFLIGRFLTQAAGAFFNQWVALFSVCAATFGTIAIFEHVNQGRPDEGLVLVNQVFTGLDQIRGMEFGNEAQRGDEFLMAGGVAGTAGVIVLRRTEGGRNLEIVVRNLDIPTRTSFVWL